MKTNISSIHFKTDKELENFIEKKIGKLVNIYDEVVSSKVILQVMNAETQNNKSVEIKLIIKGNNLFAKKQSKTFEEATGNAVEALRKQLIKRKEKIRTK